MFIVCGSGQSGSLWLRFCEGSPSASAPLPRAVPFPPPLALPSPRKRLCPFLSAGALSGGSPSPRPPRPLPAQNNYSIYLGFYYY